MLKTAPGFIIVDQLLQNSTVWRRNGPMVPLARRLGAVTKYVFWNISFGGSSSYPRPLSVYGMGAVGGSTVTLTQSGHI